MRRRRWWLIIGAAALATALVFSLADFQWSRSTARVEATAAHSSAGQVELGGEDMPQVYVDPALGEGRHLGDLLVEAMERQGLMGVGGVPGWQSPAPDVVQDLGRLDPERPVLAVYALDTTHRYTPVHGTARGVLELAFATTPDKLPARLPDPSLGVLDQPGQFVFRSEVALDFQATGLMTWPAFREMVLEALAGAAVDKLVEAIR